ncbi:MAG: hypothetical protein KJO34_16010 [Deltaproteobacteria bacterium]|nr:hypothetical protein [Deltaproteobacteria bacterium]
MSASYWKMVGENIAKGVGEKTIRRFSTGGKFLGRAGTVLGIGFLVYELFKNYKENIENEPAYKEMMTLQEEMEKWNSAISCIGREPIEKRDYGSFDEGGAINALYRKKVIGGHACKDADPQEAYTLIGRSVNYIRETENLLANDQFEENRKALISRLRSIRKKINTVADYRPIQNNLAQIVAEIRPIEAGYATRIYDCSQEIQKTFGSNAAWAAISMVTLGLVKKSEM